MTTRPAEAAMSTAARIAAGAPVASTTTGGPPSPAHSRARPTTSSWLGPRDRLGARRAADLEPVLEPVDEQHARAALEGGDRRRLADRAGAEHDDPLARLDPRPVHGADGDRHRLGERGDLGAVLGDREDLRRRHRQALLEAAVGVDADEAEAVADVAAADAARVAVAAGRERPQRDPDAGAQRVVAARADGVDRRRDLVALDARQRRADGLVQLAGEEVEVRPADPDGLGPDDDLARRPAGPARARRRGAPSSAGRG